MTVVGLQPWLPWPLSRWSWWTEPVRAERLAALRIGLALCLFVDILTTYLPDCELFFGRDRLGVPQVLDRELRPGKYAWSLFASEKDVAVLQGGMVVWAIAAFCLGIGLCTRLSALAAWVLSTSIASLNSFIDNGGDQIRGITLLYLLLTPCGAAWSVDAWWSRRYRWFHRLAQPNREPFFVSPWALRLMFVQMCLVYFANGVHKALGSTWWEGTSLYYVLGDLTLARFSLATFPVPLWLLKVLTWTVLLWELTFPLGASLPWTRTVYLWIGVFFHLGIAALLELGGFGFYMLCLYLPLVPWEKWGQQRELGV